MKPHSQHRSTFSRCVPRSACFAESTRGHVHFGTRTTLFVRSLLSVGDTTAVWRSTLRVPWSVCMAVVFLPTCRPTSHPVGLRGRGGSRSASSVDLQTHGTHPSLRLRGHVSLTRHVSHHGFPRGVLPISLRLDCILQIILEPGVVIPDVSPG